MKKFYIIIIFMIIYTIANNKSAFVGITPVFNARYKSFDNAFHLRFKDKNDVWLVLGNRGIRNYYRERFSDNWMFWDDHSSTDNIGISGNYLDPENWKRAAKLLPRRVNYIAVDFNDLIYNSKRNLILKASRSALKTRGIFCLEDDFNNKTGEFRCFNNEDFLELSRYFDIKFAYYDGYISSLPYTSNQSANKRSEMYKGIETMILRLVSASLDEKLILVPNMTNRLFAQLYTINDSLKQDLVRDVLNTPYMLQLVKDYAFNVSERDNIEKMIEDEEKNIESLKKDIENYKKISDLSSGVSSKLEMLSKGVNAVSKGVGFLTDSKTNTDFSFMNKLSKYITKATSTNTTEIATKLKEKQEQLIKKQGALGELKVQLKVQNMNIKNVSTTILRCNDEVFARFEKDKYLQPYVEFKKTKLEDIISEVNKSEKDFWDNYDSRWASSDIEDIAKELEKSWSPDVIKNNLVSLDTLKAEGKNSIHPTQRILILFERK